MASVSRVSRALPKRLMHSSAARRAITNFQMPAMSPTMTEGGIASWKKKEGETFSQGDVLLEIETDKATIDVEAQDDGIMAKIIAADGAKNVPVGKIIALLAEEGDDISNLEIPKDDVAPPKPAEETTPAPPASTAETSPAQSSQSSHSHAPPEHSRPLFPSVYRLLAEHNVTNLDAIKGTGVRGMITKGDVLTYLGKASGPLGTFKFGPSPIEEALKAGGKKATTPPPAPLDGPALRRLIVSSMLQTSQKARNPLPADTKSADFDSILADYLPPTAKSSPPKAPIIPATIPSKKADFLEGLY